MSERDTLTEVSQSRFRGVFILMMIQSFSAEIIIIIADVRNEKFSSCLFIYLFIYLHVLIGIFHHVTFYDLI